MRASDGAPLRPWTEIVGLPLPSQHSAHDKSLPTRSAIVAGSPKAVGRRERGDMRRGLFESGNSIVISLPRAFLEFLNLEEGSEVSVSLDRQRGVIVVAPATRALPRVDAEFGRQVAEFIEQYRPALEALARERPDGS